MDNWRKTKCRTCKIQRKQKICNACHEFDKHIQMTNAEYIRTMSDEELAEYLLESCDNPIQEYNEDICDYCREYVKEEPYCDDETCKTALLCWLRKEVENKNG